MLFKICYKLESGSHCLLQIFRQQETKLEELETLYQEILHLNEASDHRFEKALTDLGEFGTLLKNRMSTTSLADLGLRKLSGARISKAQLSAHEICTSKCKHPPQSLGALESCYHFLAEV